MKIENYINDRNLQELKKDLGEERYNHSLNVAKEAKILSRIYGADEFKAEIAGLFHDCGKFFDKNLEKEAIEKYNLKDNEEIKLAKKLIHCYLGPEIAEEKYDIHDSEILNAIRYHTTLNEKPTLLEKIIYLADAIEPGRNYDEVFELRILSKKNLDAACLKSLDYTIKGLVDRKLYIGLDTINARNYFLLNRGGNIG